jgi:hypothetical protein
MVTDEKSNQYGVNRRRLAESNDSRRLRHLQDFSGFKDGRRITQPHFYFSEQSSPATRVIRRLVPFHCTDVAPSSGNVSGLLWQISGHSKSYTAYRLWTRLQTQLMHF